MFLLDTRESMMVTNASVLSRIWMLQARNALVMNLQRMNGTTATQSNVLMMVMLIVSLIFQNSKRKHLFWYIFSISCLLLESVEEAD